MSEESRGRRQDRPRVKVTWGGERVQKGKGSDTREGARGCEQRPWNVLQKLGADTGSTCPSGGAPRRAKCLRVGQAAGAALQVPVSSVLLGLDFLLWHLSFSQFLPGGSL